MSTTTAIAVFVKTPKLSPIKTRLAKDIGQKEALDFYIKSIQSIEAMLNTLDVSLYWAVKEKDGLSHKLWQNHPQIHAQGSCLGAVQDGIYSQLLQNKKYDQVILLGADCPQMPASYIKQAMRALKNHNYVTGAANDGGYTLFGGRTKITAEIWKSVKYSQNNTLEKLEAALGSDSDSGSSNGRGSGSGNGRGNIHRLKASYTDVDTKDDLLAMAKEKS